MTPPLEVRCLVANLEGLCLGWKQLAEHHKRQWEENSIAESRRAWLIYEHCIEDLQGELRRVMQAVALA